MVSSVPLAEGARGPFRDRLESGGHPYRLAFFDVQVLAKYRDQQEKYDFEDDAVGGWLATKDEYYFSLPEDTRDDETFAQVRYGRRQLATGAAAIAAVLRDLANLPYKEQSYWHSHELRQPLFAEDDPSFHKFQRENYGGEFVDHQDPIDMIYQTIEGINSLFAPEALFLVDIPNPYLQYPVINTRRAYNDAHKELCKVIGLDWHKKLNASLLERLLMQLGRPIGTHGREGSWSKLKRLVAALLPQEHDGVLSPLEKCRTARQQASHVVEQPQLTAADFREGFRADCAEVADSLAAVRAALERIQRRRE
jgi:hypothetical protein